MDHVSDERVAANRQALWEATDEFRSRAGQGLEALVDQARTLLGQGRSADVYMELTFKMTFQNRLPGENPPSIQLMGMLCEATVRLVQQN